MRVGTLAIAGLLLARAASAAPSAPAAERAGDAPRTEVAWASAALADRVFERPEGALPGDAKALEQYESKGLKTLRVSLMGLGPPVPSGSGWVAFEIGAGPGQAGPLRAWAPTAPGATRFALSAPSLLGVAPEVVLAAHASGRIGRLGDGGALPTAADLQPVPEPGSALLLGLGLAGLRRARSVR